MTTRNNVRPRILNLLLENVFPKIAGLIGGGGKWLLAGGSAGNWLKAGASGSWLKAG
jgi:hypothetical protein